MTGKEVLSFARVYAVLDAYMHFKSLAEKLTAEELQALERIRKAMED